MGRVCRRPSEAGSAFPRPSPTLPGGPTLTCSYRKQPCSAGEPWAARSPVIAAAGIPSSSRTSSRSSSTTGLEKAREVTSQLDRLVKKEKLTQEQADAALEVWGASTGTTDYEGFGDVDFVIEAVPEKMDIKQTVFEELDAVTPGHAILASNTSSLSITEIGDATLRPDKVVGFHFFYPASVMPLIEIIAGEDTTRRPWSTLNFAQAIRKQPILCADVPGFVVNRILNSASARSGAPRRSRGCRSRRSTRRSRGRRLADGPVLPRRLARARHRLHVAEHLNGPTATASTCTRAWEARQGGEARRQEAAPASSRRRAAIDGDGEPTPTSSPSC